MEKTLHVEEDIHAIAALLDGFFKDLYVQPSRYWAKAITDTLLLPFLKRREIQKAMIYGERNPLARPLLNPTDNRRQDWMVWLVPLLTHQEETIDTSNEEKTIATTNTIIATATTITIMATTPTSTTSSSASLTITPTTPATILATTPTTTVLTTTTATPLTATTTCTSTSSAITSVTAATTAVATTTATTDSVTSIGVVIVSTCLYWVFLTQSSEEFASILTEMQTKMELLGWGEMSRSRVQAVYKALVSKITHRWTTENTNHYWHSLNVLASQIEEFVFYTPLYGYKVKPDPNVLGVHTDKNGVCEKELLQQLTDLLVLQLASGKQQTVNRMTDKRETAEFNKHKEALEETRQFLVCALTWSLAFAAGLEGGTNSSSLSGSSSTSSSISSGEDTRKKAWSTSRDGSHVNINDRVQVKNKQEEILCGVVMYKGLIGTHITIGVCLDERQNNSISNGVHAGKMYFACPEGFGIFVKPEHVQLEEIFVSPVYDKATLLLVDMLSKRARFKNSSKKQALECMRNALLGCLRSVRNEEKKGGNSGLVALTPTSSNEVLDVSFDLALEQARAGSQSLHRLVTYVTKIIETKTMYVQNLDKATQQDESMKVVADEMSSCVEISAFVKYLENSMSTRLRNFITTVTGEVLQPLQVLENEYESFLVSFRTQYARIGRDLDIAKSSLLKLLEEAEKELQEVITAMKFSSDNTSVGKVQRKANVVQKCATCFGRYEQASAEYSNKTYTEAKTMQRKLIKDFEAREHHRLLSIQVLLQRYVVAFSSLNNTYPQLQNFEKELVSFSIASDLLRFTTRAQRQEPMLTIPALPCSAVDIVTGAFLDIVVKKDKPGELGFDGVEKGWFASETSHKRQMSRDVSLSHLISRPTPSSPPPPPRPLPRLALPSSSASSASSSCSSPSLSSSRHVSSRPSAFSKLYQKVTDIFPDSSQGVEINDAAAAIDLTHISFPFASIKEKWLFHSDEFLSSQSDPGPSSALHGALCCLRGLYELGGGTWSMSLPIEIGLLSKTSDCGNTSVSMGLAWVYFQEKKDNQAVAFLVCGNGGSRLQLYVKTKGIVSCVLEYRPPSIKGVFANLRCGGYQPKREVGVEQIKLDIQSLLSSAPWIANDKFRNKLAKQFKIGEKKLHIPIFGYVSGAIRDFWESETEEESQCVIEATINAILGSCLGQDSQFSCFLPGERPSYLMRQILEGQMELVACRALYRQYGSVVSSSEKSNSGTSNSNERSSGMSVIGSSGSNRQFLEPVISLGVGKGTCQWTYANVNRVDDYSLYCLDPIMKFGMDSANFTERLCSAIKNKYNNNNNNDSNSRSDSNSDRSSMERSGGTISRSGENDLLALMQSVVDRGNIPVIALKSGCLLKLSQNFSGRQRRKALVEPFLHSPRLPFPISVVFTRRSGTGPRCPRTLTSSSVAVACADACRVLASQEDGQEVQFLRVELEGQNEVYLQDLSLLTPGTVLCFSTASELQGHVKHHRAPSDYLPSNSEEKARESFTVPPPPQRDSDNFPGPPRDSLVPGPPTERDSLVPGPPPLEPFEYGDDSSPGTPIFRRDIS